MVFAFITSLFSRAQEPPKLDSFLKMLWLSSKTEWVVTLLEQMTTIEPTAPVLFLQQLQESHVTRNTSEIIKNILIKYYQPENGVCLQISKMLVEGTFVGAACALAIGNEKGTYNKNFYHKVRVLKGLEIGAWRKFLNTVKAKMDEWQPTMKTKTIEYTLGLFNEPLKNTVKNTSSNNEIVSLYKGNVFKNKHLRTPVEISLDVPFCQKDFHLFAEHMGNEPIVIITKNIDEGVKVPKDVYLVFIESTKSFGEGIFPFVDSVTTWNMLDMI